VSYYCPCPIVCEEAGKDKGKEMDKSKDKGKEKDKEEKKKDAREAKLVVELPADAKLFVDGSLMKSGATTRGIVTPPLDPDRTYHYEIKVELVRFGHTLSETQRVRLIPGELVHARFPNLEARAAAIVQAEKR
jgi:uncharacterized protein (TIGR03000 family)